MESPRNGGLIRQRPTLTLRDSDVERLIGDITTENRDDLRRWAVALKRAASAWQVNRAVELSQNRLSARGRA